MTEAQQEYESIKEKFESGELLKSYKTLRAAGRTIFESAIFFGEIE